MREAAVMIESFAGPPVTEAPAAIRVCAPGRLHLGFLDPSGSLGRRFGSVGLMIDGFETEVVISSASEDAVSADTPAAHASTSSPTTMPRRDSGSRPVTCPAGSGNLSSSP